MWAPILAALAGLGTLAGSFVISILTWFSKKAAKVAIIKTSILAALFGLVAVLYTFSHTALDLIGGSVSSMMPEEFTQAYTIIIPSNLGLCLSIYISVRGINYIWKWQAHVVETYLHSL